MSSVKAIRVAVGYSRPLFIYFRPFNSQLTVNVLYKNLANDWIWTADLLIGSDHFTNWGTATALQKNFMTSRLVSHATQPHHGPTPLLCFFKMGHSRPLFLYFRLFNTQLTVNKCSIYRKIIFCRWLDSNRGHLVSEAAALPTQPHHCPIKSYFSVESSFNLKWSKL